MERAIGIIKREIEKRKSMLMNAEYFLRTNQIKCEIESLSKVLDLVNKNYLSQRASKSVCPECGYPRFKKSFENFERCEGCEWTSK